MICRFLPSHWFRAAILAMVFSAMSSTLAAPAPADVAPYCSKRKQVTDVVIRLIEQKTVTIEKIQWQMGVFQVQNKGNAPLFLEGSRRNGYFDIDYPEIIQEFRSTDGKWHEYMYAAGSFLGPADKIEILPGGTDTFMTILEPDNTLAGFYTPDTGESRIAYNDHAQRHCIYSEVFTIAKPKP